MTGVGFSEFMLILVIGLLILGPERLPRVASQIGRWVARARRTANQLRHQLEREIALSEIKKPPPKKPTKNPPDAARSETEQAPETEQADDAQTSRAESSGTKSPGAGTDSSVASPDDTTEPEPEPRR